MASHVLTVLGRDGWGREAQYPLVITCFYNCFNFMSSYDLDTLDFYSFFV